MRFLLLPLLVLASCSRTPTASEPLPHEVYVWQRQWTPAVRQGIERAAPAVAGFNVLVGEIGIQGSAVRPVVAQVDFGALARVGKPVGFGLRIATYRGDFSSKSKPLLTAIDALRTALAQAKAAGLSVSELQIDFDCPSARLAGYITWVKELRSAFPHTPLAITALPDWLAQRDFAALAKAAGKFVLQVHSVPGASGAAPVLCDGKLARQAIERAGRFGVPFRVALPTYSCELRADSSGRIVGMHAEDSQPAAESATLVLRADATEMAALVGELASRRPATLVGIVWYRLPIDTDRLNWRWPTLAAIISGKTPQPQGALVLAPSEAGGEDVVLENSGDADWTLPADLSLPTDTVTGDGVNGFLFEPDPTGSWKLHGPTGRILAPGGRMVCGWIRRSQTPAVHPPIQLSLR